MQTNRGTPESKPDLFKTFCTQASNVTMDPTSPREKEMGEMQGFRSMFIKINVGASQHRRLEAQPMLPSDGLTGLKTGGPLSAGTEDIESAFTRPPFIIPLLDRLGGPITPIPRWLLPVVIPRPFPPSPRPPLVPVVG